MQVISRTIGLGLWSLLALACVAMALVSYRYLPGIGPMPPEILANLNAVPWLNLHVAGAATALLIGSPQFLPGLRRRWPGVHRWSGRIYVAGCFAGGVSGLFLALGSTAGPVATAGFGLLGLAWLGTTWQGWRLARLRRFEAHRRWMVRSWSLTLAAVTLRLYLPFPEVLGFTFEEGYRVISFLCWVPNLLAAELYLSATAGRRGSAATAVRTSFAHTG